MTYENTCVNINIYFRNDGDMFIKLFNRVRLQCLRRIFRLLNDSGDSKFITFA